MVNKEIGFKISYNAMMNMIDVYASSKAFCLDRETECETDEEFEFNTTSAWVIDVLDKIPVKGDGFDYKNMQVRMQKL